MTICRWKFRWATVLLLCLFAVGSASVIYRVAGRCAMGGADLSIGKAFNGHKLATIDSLSEWGQSWPLMTTSLSVIYSKVYPKVHTSKLSITYDSTIIPLISRAAQRVRQRDPNEVVAVNSYPSGRDTSGSLHIQF